jgi:cytochrome bd-type quinol oxidase subunit 2
MRDVKPRNRRRIWLLALGLCLGAFAVLTTLQERRDVAAQRVESYSTFPVLVLAFAGTLILISAFLFVTEDVRRPRFALFGVAMFLGFIVTTRALWDTRLPLRVELPRGNDQGVTPRGISEPGAPTSFAGIRPPNRPTHASR